MKFNNCIVQVTHSIDRIPTLSFLKGFLFEDISLSRYNWAILHKSRTWETLNLSTDADSSIDTKILV